MKKLRIPQTDSIHELARFWDEHDLTDFEDQLEEVTEPVFERQTVVKIPLLDPRRLKRLRNSPNPKGSRMQS